MITIDLLNPYDHEDSDWLAANTEGIIDPYAA
jgi:hypothetical protein